MNMICGVLNYLMKGYLRMSCDNIVLFTQRVEVVEPYNERRDCADQRISKLIRSCGYIPIAISNDASLVTPIVESINPSGIMLTGGNSLVKYGGNAPERDDTDRALIELAVSRRIPLYGFCRGMQSILDYYENVLTNVTGHVALMHKVVGEDEEYIVNSYHNQGCKELKTDELIVLLRAEDGVIEKVKHKTLPIVATMWHPERNEEYDENDIEMIRELFGGEYL